jgi:hypothetical protein
MALYEFVADEQIFKQPVSISNAYSKYSEKKNIWSAKWILYDDPTFPDS